MGCVDLSTNTVDRNEQVVAYRKAISRMADSRCVHGPTCCASPKNEHCGCPEETRRLHFLYIHIRGNGLVQMICGFVSGAICIQTSALRVVLLRGCCNECLRPSLPMVVVRVLLCQDPSTVPKKHLCSVLKSCSYVHEPSAFHRKASHRVARTSVPCTSSSSRATPARPPVHAAAEICCN